MSRKFLAACFAVAVAAVTSPLHADDVIFTFRGQITQIPAPTTTTFQVGDPFVLYLDFTPGGATPALGYYLTSGKRNGSVQGVHNALVNNGVTSYSTGTAPPYFDNYFANFSDPFGYQMYCYTYMNYSLGTLSFGMFDEDAGPWGSLAVNSQFPGTWLSNMSNPLPGNATSINFAASGPLYLDYNNIPGADLTGAVTSVTISRLHTNGNKTYADLAPLAFSATAAPEPASLALLTLGAAVLLTRRRAQRSC
jgi:hypothetical protein